MTDVTTQQDQDTPALSTADEQVLLELTERARAGGLKLTGEGGLLGKLTRMVMESVLEGEVDDHLGYGKNDPVGRDGGNSRNGHHAAAYVWRTQRHADSKRHVGLVGVVLLGLQGRFIPVYLVARGLQMIAKHVRAGRPDLGMLPGHGAAVPWPG